jgi:hypothetical protein
MKKYLGFGLNSSFVESLDAFFCWLSSVWIVGHKSVSSLPTWRFDHPCRFPSFEFQDSTPLRPSLGSKAWRFARCTVAAHSFNFLKVQP